MAMFAEKEIMPTIMPQQVEHKSTSTAERSNQKSDALPNLSYSKEGNQNKFLSQVGKKDEKTIDTSPTDESIIESAADKAETPDVSLPEVDSPTTPEKMLEKRIPPRVGTEVDVTVNKGTATISVANQDAGNGTVLLNDQKELSLKKGTHKISLKGKDQTTPGNSSKLKLVAKNGKKEITSSNGFSVAAIPQNWSSIYDQPASFENFDAVGVKVVNKWESDSGEIADLDMAMRAENVQHYEKTGFFSTATGNNSSYVDANTGQIEDRHRVRPRANIKEGTIDTQQTFRFKCSRTGAIDIPATNAGFKITRDVRKKESDISSLEIQVTKKGFARSANGYYSDAGNADIDKTYDI
jgi:hypothetical protein